MTGLVMTAQLDICSITHKRYLRSYGKQGDLSQLGSDEYFTFSIRVQNQGTCDFTWKDACVSVDGGEPWHWPSGKLPVSGRALFRISYRNMKKCMTPGAHTVIWYFDGQAVHQETFVITRTTPDMDWEAVFPFPTRKEIEEHQRQNKHRSPYLCGWLNISSYTRYTEYCIDFRAGHLPKGTYYSLGNWAMDLSGLEKRFKSVRTDGNIHAYAGFQRLSNGQTASIMSFWDIYCTDRSGRERVLRPKLLYPENPVEGNQFWGEGTGARCIAPFDWEAGHWYRMHLKSIVSPGSETTLVEQWLRDLETGEEHLLCRYDTGVPNSSFKGSIAIFLENFTAETAGEVRSMEVCNARYRDADTDRWQAITNAYISADEGQGHAQYGLLPYEGSYNFGVTGDRIWMITSGAGGNWFRNGKGKQGMTFTLAGD